MPFIPKEKFREIEIFPGVVLHAAAGERVMLSFVDFEPGSKVLPHAHSHEQMGVVLDGAFELQIGDEAKLVEKGDVYLIPPNVEHSAVASEAGARALDVFSPPREDYL